MNPWFEYSPNKRSTCKGCRKKIEKNQLRVGFMKSTIYGRTKAYMHAHCYNLDVLPKNYSNFSNDKEVTKFMQKYLEEYNKRFTPGLKKSFSTDQTK